MIERSRVRIPAGAAGEFSSPGSTFCVCMFHPRVCVCAGGRYSCIHVCGFADL